MPESKTKVAVVGFGDWGKNLLREFSLLANVSICCTEGNQLNKKILNDQYPQIIHTKNFEDILKDDTIKVVVISTPIITHFKYAKAALQAGKHVFLEKPPAQSSQEIKELIRIAKKEKVVLFFDHIFMHNPLFKKLKSISNSKLLQVFFEWQKEGSFRENIFENLAYHDIYLSLALMGKPESVNLISKFGFKTEVDVVNFGIRFRNGSSAFFYINRVSTGVRIKRVIAFSKEKEFIWQDNTLSIYNQNRQEVGSPIFTNVQPLVLVCRDFLESVRKNRNDPINHRLALGTMDIITRLKKLSPPLI